MLLRQKLTADQIRFGEPVPFDCFDSGGILLLKKGLVVESQRALSFLLERGLYATGTSPARPDPSSTPAALEEPSPFHHFDDLNARLKQIFAKIGGSNPPPPEAANGDFGMRVERIAESLQQVCKIDANATIGLLHLHSPGRYTVSHPLHRGVVCELIGRRYGLAAEERKRLLCASLTCDLSILELQEVLSKQTTPLTPEQQAAIRAHPMESAALLEALGIADRDWITAVAQHHETLSQSGYPHRPPRDSILLWARMILLADIYTAMVTPRSNRPAVTSRLAMRELFLKRGSVVDEALTVLFVKELGLYPPGSFVKLANGETAIVIRRGQDSKAPLVKAVVGPRGAPLTRHVERDSLVKEFAIQDVVERDTIVRIDLHQLWDYDGR